MIGKIIQQLLSVLVHHTIGLYRGNGKQITLTDAQRKRYIDSHDGIRLYTCVFQCNQVSRLRGN